KDSTSRALGFRSTRFALNARDLPPVDVRAAMTRAESILCAKPLRKDARQLARNNDAPTGSVYESVKPVPLATREAGPVCTAPDSLDTGLMVTERWVR